MIGLIFGETSFPKEILKKIKKKDSNTIDIIVTFLKTFEVVSALTLNLGAINYLSVSCKNVT